MQFLNWIIVYIHSEIGISSVYFQITKKGKSFMVPDCWYLLEQGVRTLEHSPGHFLNQNNQEKRQFFFLLLIYFGLSFKF